MFKRVSENVFLSRKRGELVLFNRLDFQRQYYNSPKRFSEIMVEARTMERSTVRQVFQPPQLKKFRIEATMACNCACRYCLVYKNDIRKSGVSMTLVTARKIIREYKRSIRYGSLMIIGGEPLLNWPVVQLFIEKIHDPIKIFTNGTIYTDRIARTISQNPHVRLMISLDGQRPDNINRRLKSDYESFPIVIRNIHRYRQAGCKLGITCLVTPRTVGRMPDLVRFFSKSQGIKVIGLSFPHFIKDRREFSDSMDIGKYAHGLTRIFDDCVKNHVYIDQLAKRLTPLMTKSFRFYACKGVGEEKTFYPDGGVTRCTKIDTLNKSKKYSKEYLKKILPVNNHFCRACPAIGICGGGCPWDGVMRFKHGVDERECVINTFLLEFFLWKMRALEKEGLAPKKVFSTLVK